MNNSEQALVVRAMGAFRAAGALLVEGYNAMKASVPDVPEADLLAAEVSARIGAPSVPPPGGTVAPAPGPVAAPTRIEHFPGVFYNPDADPTRADIMEGQDLSKVPVFRFVDAGYNVQSYGPINRKWKTGSMYAWVFGRGRSAIFDGSNGHEAIPPQPGYSPKGFPITYTLDENKRVIGTGSIGYADRAFNTDAEVEAYMTAEAAIAAQQPKPTAAPPAMVNSYTGRSEFMAACEGQSFAVMLDGAVVHQGFGPASQYVTAADGSIQTGHYTAPAPTGGGGSGGGDEPVPIN